MSFSNFFSEMSHAFGMSATGSMNVNTTGNFQFATQTATQPAAQEPNKQPPPASKRYMDSLVQKPVTQDDIQEANNKECLICLEDNDIGSLRVKLPCGHIFCKACISSWLCKHCTCPACRYEVECSDPQYETERRRRMQKSYKMRVRLDELKAMKIPEIRRMATQLGIDISDCIDKSDIIDKLKSSSKVDILEGVPVQEIPEDEWESMSVGRLRALLKSYGLSEDGALMKSDLRARLLDSGRVSVVPAPSSLSAGSAPNSSRSSNSLGGASYSAYSEDDAAASVDDDVDVKRVRLNTKEKAARDEYAAASAAADDHPFRNDTKPSGADCKAGGVHSSAGAKSAGASAGTGTAGAGVASTSANSHTRAPSSSNTSSSSSSSSTSTHGQFVLGKELIESMSIRELKSIMEAYGVSADKCVERRDLLDRMRASSRIILSED